MTARLTEEQIERQAERWMDGLDRMLMSGKLTQAAYDLKARALARWADQQYRRLAA
jgi:hypothetical protein